MKKIIFLLLLCAGMNAAAQNVGIGGVPHNNAMLEVRSTNKGFLMPRMTGASRQAMFGVPAGMMVYDTDGACFYYHDGNKWRKITDTNIDSTFFYYDAGVPEVTANMALFTTTNAKSGILYDAGGPAGNYSNNTFHEYLVYLGAGPTSVNDSTVFFKVVIEEMSLESPHDSLLIYTDSDYPIKITGNTLRTIYLPAVAALRFSFYTNASNVQAGFKIRWSQVMGRTAEVPPMHGWHYDAQARAVRGGLRASENEWDTEDLGTLSFGWGYDARATGLYAFSAGEKTHALGNHSLAMGDGNVALGAGSVALGIKNEAAGFYAFSAGQANRAVGEGSVALGLTSTANGLYSFAAGQSARAASTRSFAMGLNVVARGEGSFVFGKYNDTLGPSPVVTPLFTVGNGDATTRNNAMMITRDGDMALGVRIPATRLHIGGGTDASFHPTSGYMVIGDLSSTTLVFDNNEIIARDQAGSSTLYLQYDGGALEIGGTAAKPGGGSWSATSDARLKQDIRPYTDGLQALLGINPVYFHYNKQSGYNTQKEYIGVIAQELQKTAPYMVDTFKKDNNEYLSVDNSPMIYMLINAVKEQQKQIEELKKRIAELEK